MSFLAYKSHWKQVMVSKYSGERHSLIVSWKIIWVVCLQMVAIFKTLHFCPYLKVILILTALQSICINKIMFLDYTLNI